MENKVGNLRIFQIRMLKLICTYLFLIEFDFMVLQTELHFKWSILLSFIIVKNAMQLHLKLLSNRKGSDVHNVLRWQSSGLCDIR